MAGRFSVSVIVPAYNAAETIEEAVASVHGQTYPVTEVIVIDDGSTDDTAAIIERLGGGVRSDWQANAGPSVARNRGLALADGQLVAFLDADDLWPPDRMETLAGVLTREPRVEVALGHTRDLWAVAGRPPQMGPPYLTFNVGSALFHRAVFARVGVFDPSLRQGEDVDFWVRVGEQDIRRRTVADVTLHYRRRLVDSIDGIRRYKTGMIRALRRSLDRRRAGRVGPGGDA